MEVTIDSVKVTDGQAEIAFRLCGLAKNIASEIRNNRYDYESTIIKKVAGSIADYYLREHKAEIMEAINFDKLINAIKVKVVEGFSLNRP